ncbi:FMRFamide-related peptides [Drosophila ficusphila]|uniref:FMRFamide-related peptides n=1 Tax=Drosophila ficusphila TaxID=30025 RepID=UPI0007E66F58|nr:FMRFamide-related peptides [Drosophila ficusphila]XP_017045329.1 FMRFamide-related peptides [Drosophila ficusphila]
MGIALMFLLALYQMQSAIHSEIIETPAFGGNSLQDSGAPPAPQDSELVDALLAGDQDEQAELEFRHPVSVIGIDYSKNALVLRFQKHGRKPRYKLDPELEAKRRSLQDNFMHFGKRQAELLPPDGGFGGFGGSAELEGVGKRSVMDRYGRDPKQDFMRFGRDPKQDFMRFGRDPKQDFMRFGRDPKEDFMRFGRDPMQDFMRFGRDPKQDFMRFGRDPKQDFMRFGRDPKQDFMRFGRDPKQDFMRFGRTPAEDFMRFGRADNFMRFGRSPHEELRSPKQDFMRFGRPDNFMRFGRSAQQDFVRSGKMDANFIRFGKSVKPAQPESNQTKAGQPGERSPVDKAMSELFKKQEQQEQQAKSGEQASSVDEGSAEQEQEQEQEQFFGQ